MATLPGLLLMHGVGDDGACWGPFVAHLRALDLADLRIATPDAPAHGGRRATPGHTVAAADLLAEAVAHAEDLAAATGGPIVVGGHSMGSAVALALAASRPDLAVGLWLEDPPLFTSMAEDDALGTDDTPVPLTELHDWFADLQARPLDAVVAAARADHPTWEPAEYEPWARAKQSVDVAAFTRPVPWVAAGWARHARAVACPTVVAAGDPALGAIVSPRAEADLAALPGWTVHRLPAGHDVRRDAPAQTAALLAGLIHRAAR
jgi:pimeloyl-ACP methyl ester carboxylesterase